MAGCSAALDWFGWAAAMLGVGGALLLAKPLFILLRQREALESLVFVLDKNLAPADLKKKVEDARAEFAQTSRNQLRA